MPSVEVEGRCDDRTKVRTIARMMWPQAPISRARPGPAPTITDPARIGPTVDAENCSTDCQAKALLSAEAGTTSRTSAWRAGGARGAVGPVAGAGARET